MRKLITSFLICFATTASSQVQFQNISYKEALNRSNTEGKLIFLQFESKECTHCNEVADKSFDNMALSQQIEATFLPVKVTSSHPDHAMLSAQFNIKEFGTLFINQSGTLVHAFRKTTSNPKEYQKQIDIALEKAGESLKINELETEYKKGNKSPGFIETLLLKKRSLHLPTANLLEEYVTLLPADSLKSIRVLQFIAKMAPIVKSNADKVLHQDHNLFNQAWYRMSLPVRIGINNQIIYASMTKAIQEKDANYAQQVAAFAQATHSGNVVAGTKAYDKNLLRFYEETGDTALYFKKSIAYYERYFMAINADSIKRMDSAMMKRLLANAPKDTVRKDGKTIITSSVSYRPIAQGYMSELNHEAWNFYKKTNNIYLLTVATEWAVKALEFYPSPEVMDTHARLLYKQGLKQKAIQLEKEAMALTQKRGFSTKEYELVIEKMTKGVSSID